MNNIVIGTAGHVDHGKTALVKALTGVHTDKLQEEIQRGMTIELGFAPFRHKGVQFSLIDVPGHSKLIKTMVAGATGMQLALLVIDVKEGIMPQTREHLHILKALGVKQYIVVITKVDMVEQEVVRSLRSEIEACMLQELDEQVTIIPVSAYTGQGIQELKDEIYSLASQDHFVSPRDFFRMSIDRVFTLKGQGTIVTGTIADGKIAVGDELMILQDKNVVKTKARGLHIHNKSVQSGEVGQRCAINLTGVSSGELKKGQVLTSNPDLEATNILDCKLSMMGEGQLNNNQRVRIHIGTRDVIGKVKLMDCDRIKNNGHGYGTIKLETPIVAMVGDSFIMRNLSPVETIGGGKVLNTNTYFQQRHQPEVINYFSVLSDNQLIPKVLLLLDHNRGGMTKEGLYQNLFCHREDLDSVLEHLVSQDKIIRLSHRWFMGLNHVNKMEAQLKKRLSEYFCKYSYTLFVPISQLHSRFFPYMENEVFQGLINHWQGEKLLKTKNSHVYMSDKSLQAYRENSEVIKILDAVIKAGIVGAESKNIAMKEVQKRHKKEILSSLCIMGEITHLGKGLYMKNEKLQEIKETIIEMLKGMDSVSVIQMRDQLGIGRKRTIEILEYLDDTLFTKRIENERKLHENISEAKLSSS